MYIKLRHPKTLMKMIFRLQVLFLLCLLPATLCAVRDKDIASLRGARDNQLNGFGIVVGLDGTGPTEPLEHADDSVDERLAQRWVVGDP